MPLNYILSQAFGWFRRTSFGVVNGIKNARNRKVLILFALFVLFMLYTASAYLKPAHRHFHQSQVQDRVKKSTCLDASLEKWSLLMADSDAVIKEIPESSQENKFFPFSGNGNLGYAVNRGARNFYIMTEEEYVDVPFIPSLDAKVVEKASNKKQAIALDIKGGTLHVFTSYIVNKSCIVIEETLYSHRIHKDVFMQNIEIRNTGMFPVTVEFSINSDNRKHFKFSSLSSNTKHEDVKYSVLQEDLTSSSFDNKVHVVMSISDYQPTIRVPQRSKNKVHLISVTKFKFTNKQKGNKRRAVEVKHENDLVKTTTDQLIDIVNMKPDTLLGQHLNSWDDIWEVGVSIGSESDPDSPSSLHVNLTEYYIYSNLQYNPAKNSNELLECFSGPPTIHNAELWVIPSTIKSIYGLKTTWNTLFKQSGCIQQQASTDVNLIRESMVLSFIGLQYKKYHLQLALNPLNLRSNISIRHLQLLHFNSPDILDFQISVSKTNSDQFLLVTTAGKHQPVMYGCSTACGHVVQLGGSALKFPVYTTDPVTPLFYISTNKSHLEKVGKTKFMISAKNNAKSSHQETLEVHHLKLSPKFWLAVIILIVSFHVIILKMIYNECPKDRRGRWGPF